MTDDELRVWAAAHEPAGSTLARGVLRLLAERDAARAVAAGLAERVAGQSELLSRRAGAETK